MKTLIVASTRPYAGKSGITIAVLAALGARGLRAGYFKPYGTMPVEVDGVLTDQDAAYIASLAPVRAPAVDVCPIVETPAFVEDVLRGEVGVLDQRVREAFLSASREADCMLVEGMSDLSQARSVGIALCQLAEMLDASVLLVDKPERSNPPDAALWAADCLGERLLGVVFNAVSDSMRSLVAENMTRFLEANGVHVFGTLPHDALLSSVTVDEIVEHLGGTVLCAEERTGESVESFMVGAMGQDKALRFFRRKARKAVITGGDRSDVQLAALETDTRCIVLTGNLPPSSLVLARAEELGVPMVIVPMDTLTAVERMESLLGRVRLHDPAKAGRMREMFEAAVDVDDLISKAFPA